MVKNAWNFILPAWILAAFSLWYGGACSMAGNVVQALRHLGRDSTAAVVRWRRSRGI